MSRKTRSCLEAGKQSHRRVNGQEIFAMRGDLEKKIYTGHELRSITLHLFIIESRSVRCFQMHRGDIRI